MFKLNKPIKTTKGELVTPILVEGDLVYIIDSDGNQKNLNLSDFDINKKEVKKNEPIIVEKKEFPKTDMIPIKEEPIIIKNIPIEETVIIENLSIKEEPIIIKEEPIKVTKQIADDFYGGF